MGSNENGRLESAHLAVFKRSENLEGKSIKIMGYDFNQGVDYSQLLKSMVSTGFQASNLGDAFDIVNQMLDWRLSDESITEECSEKEKDPAYRESVTCKIFLGFTSNLISSGVRETIRYLAQHRMVDVMVTTAGGIEEDFIKCLAPTYKGDFALAGAQITSQVFCPAITDGSIGDMLYFHSFRSPPAESIDVRAMNDEAVNASPRKTGMVILGGGLPKHHICNANMMRNGADFAVYINTAQEFDGSDSGARPDEAVSWGKIRANAKTVKVHCDATIAFPLVVAETFAQRQSKSVKSKSANSILDNSNGIMK
ncbi:hypothetical protein Patl1_25383 [Pistacia atlantica]|uniref:Uncharacterized protein n=1 Tax=Pistacia atlantica TaxID=434234 RepID=A0ACC1B0E7_9ROSI|nr:hypothetical protein Patl1_25383 [Pistacia atlantica]